MRSYHKLHIRNVKKEFSSEAVLVTSADDITTPCNTYEVSHSTYDDFQFSDNVLINASNVFDVNKRNVQYH